MSAQQLQLQIFESTKKLNLSEAYELIPKEVSINDPRIEWITNDEKTKIAKPVEKVFMMGEKTYISEISPANFVSKRNKKYQSYFPDFRESRIEYALITIVSKKNSKLEIHTDKENNKIFLLHTTYYQIQKEIIDAINKKEGKTLKVKDCPYSTTDIKEGLEILKRCEIALYPPGEEAKKAIANRIKDIYLDNKRVVIELGSMITGYIESGEWRSTDSDSILASKARYELKIRVQFQLKVRFASKGIPYRISLNKLIQDIDFIENKEKRITLQKVINIIDKMSEVEKVVIEKKTEGNRKKIVDANLYIYFTEDFVNTMIQNNKLTKRAKDAVIDEKNNIVVIEPLESDFNNRSEYQKAKSLYEVKKVKAIL